MGKYNAIPAYERAGLSRLEAAEYVGVSPTLFDQAVEDGRMPPPHHLNNRRVRSRRELDRYFEELPRSERSPGRQGENELKIAQSEPCLETRALEVLEVRQKQARETAPVRPSTRSENDPSACR